MSRGRGFSALRYSHPTTPSCNSLSHTTGTAEVGTLDLNSKGAGCAGALWQHQDCLGFFLPLSHSRKPPFFAVVSCLWPFL